ncbi:Cytochrome p450 [Thalictrum thalictroides]|uniref:Cytochrome p450 n=1 Tax=Thalictrum thalictroides TaxID=46969 RepID=A0A7J6VME5_THATH|nr:Cytochrome p450 [Thalictrum thalictroides]
MMSTKEDILQTLVVIVGVVLVSWAWKTISSIWLKPKKMEKYLREQGLKGPNYKFLYGDTKEIGRLTKEARSKPMENSHQIVPRVFPYYHQVVQQYGKMSYFWFRPMPRLIVMDPDKQMAEFNSRGVLRIGCVA